MMTALIGPSRTKYMVMTGRPIDAATALEWGVVDFVVPPEELDARALELARDVAAKPPINLAMAQERVNLMHGPTIRHGTRAERSAQSDLIKRSDERRGGKECVSKCRSRGSPYPSKKK